MENIQKGKELKVITEDRVGVLAEITNILAEEGVNIENLCIYTTTGQAIFYFITDNNEKTKKILGEKGYDVKEQEIVILSLDDRPGALSKVARKLKEETIDLHYVYGTTSGKGKKTIVVFSSNNNDKAVEVLKFVLSLNDWAR